MRCTASALGATSPSPSASPSASATVALEVALADSSSSPRLHGLASSRQASWRCGSGSLQPVPSLTPALGGAVAGVLPGCGGSVLFITVVTCAMYHAHWIGTLMGAVAEPRRTVTNVPSGRRRYLL